MIKQLLLKRQLFFYTR